MPSSLADEIAAAYRLLSERCETAAVAVRSSAVDEDSAAASFAGQHQTCLNITGLDGLLNAIEVCWSSFWSSAATDYRRNRGLTVDRRRVAVLVQQLVLADVSAIAFTAETRSAAGEGRSRSTRPGGWERALSEERSCPTAIPSAKPTTR